MVSHATPATGVCDRCGQKEVSRGPGLHPVTAVGLHGPDWEGHQSHHYATLNSSDEPNRAESFCSFYPDMQQLGYTHRASLKHPRARASSQPWPAWPAWSLASSTGVAKSTGVPRRSRSTPLSTPLSSTAMTMNDEARDGGWLCVMDGLGDAGGAACCGVHHLLLVFTTAVFTGPLPIAAGHRCERSWRGWTRAEAEQQEESFSSAVRCAHTSFGCCTKVCIDCTPPKK